MFLFKMYYNQHDKRYQGKIEKENIIKESLLGSFSLLHIL